MQGSDEANHGPGREHPANRSDVHVWISDRTHPHYGESGVMTGKVIQLFGTLMAEIRLDHCTHGTDGCFVTQGQIREDDRA